jgi:general secretion pathway protein K
MTRASRSGQPPIQRPNQKRSHRQGGILLGVLWLVAILTIIAFSIAVRVRSETERSGTLLDATRSYYVASAGADRALLDILYTTRFGLGQTYRPERSRFAIQLPEGVADLEIIPENSKIDINFTPPEVLTRLLVALGEPPDRAANIVRAIVDWRTPRPAGALTEFDQFYLTQRPSFLSAHASFQETEELLMVQGVTPDLFYGRYVRQESGNLLALGGLRDCVSVYQPGEVKDINSVEPAVMAAFGVPAPAIQAIVETRRRVPFGQKELAQLAPQLGAAGGRFKIGGDSIFALRSTGRGRRPDGQLSDIRRTVMATYKLFPQGKEPSMQVLRWHDRTWVNGDTVQ